MTTRREVLLHGAIGAGVLATNMSGFGALQAAAPPLRRSISDLAWNDPIVATYRDAVGIMKQMPTAQKFSWPALATIHGYNPNQFHYCPHGDWYFLPWHRAYTAMYERIVRKLTGNAGFAMPYWDWTRNPMFPQVFIDPKTPDGKTNWLCVTDPGYQRTWNMSQPMPPEIVGPQVLQTILTAVGYENFGTSRNPRQNNTDPRWVPAGGGVQGTLEHTPHNLVHNNIGGWMPTASSPRDPVFFMHHANIDRIWALWNTRNPNSTDPLWTGMQFTNNFWNPDGTPWSPRVSDLYSPEALGYTYGLRNAAVPRQPRFVALTNKLNSVVGLGLGAASPAGVATVTVANDRTATPDRPLEIAVTLPAPALGALRRSGGLKSTVDFSASDAVRERAAAAPRVLAFLRDVEITAPATTMFRIFVDAEGVGPRTPQSDPHYVGTFGMLRHGGGSGDAAGDEHAGHGAAAGGEDHGRAPPSFVLDLTDALARTGGASDGRIRLQIVPVPIDAPGATPGTARPSRVEVTLITA